MQEADLAALAGRPLPGGRYRIEQADNREFCEAIGAEPDPRGHAHPLYYYIAGRVAMGVSVSELLAMCDFDVNDGPMMIGSEVSFAQDLKVDVEYSVSGNIVSLVRKPSRAFGVADTLKFKLTLADAQGAEAAVAINSWILPRRGLA